MKICIATDFDIIVASGKYYVKTQISTILRRYFAAFGQIIFVGRKSKNVKIDSSVEDVTEIICDTYCLNSLYDVFRPAFKSNLKNIVSNCDLVISRCPSLIAYAAADEARRQKKPYMTESMGCAWDAYWNHGIAGKIIAPYMFFKMKQVVKNANFATYVTTEFLQSRYPCKNESIGVSNVLIKEIDESVLERRIEKINSMDTSNITLMTTAAVNVRYKGQEYVIKAIPKLNKKGIRVRYVLVGGGDDSYLRSVAKKYKVEDQVVFMGRQPLNKVFELLDEADIYVQPSLQEGLPRSVIEAMSRACPCIGAKTAGIPELIHPKLVVRRKNVNDIADKVSSIIDSDFKEIIDITKSNFINAKDFKNTVLETRRNDYYNKILESMA